MPEMPSRLFLPILHFSFFLTGIATTMLGVLLPFLIVRWSISDSQAGSLFGAQFVASFLGSLLYGLMAKRLGNKNTTIAGLIIIAVGVVLLAKAGWPFALGAVAIYGFGLGTALPATNLLVAEISGPRRAAALNLLNFSWTLGAVVAPLGLVYMLERRHMPLSSALEGFAIVTAASALLVYFSRTPTPVLIESVPKEPTNLNVPAWILTGLLLFLYVGVENAIPGWSPLLGLREQTLTNTTIAVALSLFWGALLLGRLAAGVVWHHASPGAVITCSLAVAMAGAALIAVSPNRSTLLIGMVLSGGGLAAIFPTVVAVFSAQVTGRAKLWEGTLFASAGLGGAALPPLIGVLSSRGYSLRTGIWLLAAMTGVMLIIELYLSRGATSEPSAGSRRYRAAPAE